MKKWPALHLYIGDLEKDPNFRLCDWQAQNLWIRMLLHLHEQKPRGQFRLGEAPMTEEQIAKIITTPMAHFRKLLWQLLKNGVAERIDGAIANRRMVREEQIREMKSQSGKAGAALRWHTDDTGDGTSVTDPNSYPSSMSSSSSSSSSLTPTPSLTPTISNTAIEQKKEKKEKSSGATDKAVARSGETWAAYAEAYTSRYGVAPVRNAAVNKHLSNLVIRLGAHDAPCVAAFYMSHNNPAYVQRRHPTWMLVSDAEGLRTQWATGIKSTSGEAKNAERRDDALAQIERVRRAMQKGT